jgi:hypothetical protein
MKRGPKVTTKRGEVLGKHISLRLSLHEYDQLVAVAEVRGHTVQHVLRDAINSAAIRWREVALGAERKTGIIQRHGTATRKWDI